MIWRGKGRAASVPSVQLDRMKAAAENFPALRSAHHMILIQANAPMDRSTSRYRHDQRVHIATRSEEHTYELQFTNAHLVCRPLLETQKKLSANTPTNNTYHKSK